MFGCRNEAVMSDTLLCWSSFEMDHTSVYLHNCSHLLGLPNDCYLAPFFCSSQFIGGVEYNEYWDSIQILTGSVTNRILITNYKQNKQRFQFKAPFDAKSVNK